MEQFLMYLLPLGGLLAGIGAWFANARGKNAMALAIAEAFGIALVMTGG